MAHQRLLQCADFASVQIWDQEWTIIPLFLYFLLVKTLKALCLASAILTFADFSLMAAAINTLLITFLVARTRPLFPLQPAFLCYEHWSDKHLFRKTPCKLRVFLALLQWSNDKWLIDLFFHSYSFSYFRAELIILLGTFSIPITSLDYPVYVQALPSSE